MTPKYIQIFDALTGMIRDGTYPVNSRLPTEAALSSSYHVSRQTVRQALSLLKDKGLIEKKRGSCSQVVFTGPEGGARNVAIVVSSTNDYIYPSLLRDIQTALSQSNYSFQIFSTQNKVSREGEALQQILSQPFAGLLAEGVKTALPNPNLSFYRQLEKKNIPFVFLHGGYAELGKTVCVMDDNYRGGYQLTRYLISKGHTRIGGIFNGDDIQGRQRYQGYVAAFYDAGLPVPEDNLLWYSTEDRQSILEGNDLSLLKHYVQSRLPGCTALVVYNDEIAYHMLLILQEAGYDIPNAISIVSFDNSYYCGLSPVPITSMSHEGTHTGSAAANQLLRMLRGEEANSVCIPWTLIERKSS